MSRVKRGTSVKRRHKKLLKQTKGFWGQRKNVFLRAKQTLMRAMRFAYISRRLRKRDFRSLFISRISASCKSHQISYSKFTHLLKKANVVLNRKMLSQIAVLDPTVFSFIVQYVQTHA